MSDEKPAVQPVLLLVDDTPTNLQVLFKTLSGRGLKLLIAKDGESGEPSKPNMLAKAVRPRMP